MTSTSVPGSTGNCEVVSIVLLVHSVFSPVQSGAVEVVCNFYLAVGIYFLPDFLINIYQIYTFRRESLMLSHSEIRSKQLINFTCLPGL